jgi:hypothetical protein
MFPTSGFLLLVLGFSITMVIAKKKDECFKYDVGMWIVTALLVGILVPSVICGLGGLCASISAETTIIESETYELLPCTTGQYTTNFYLSRYHSASNGYMYTYTYIVPGKGGTNSEVRESHSYVNYISEDETPYVEIIHQDFADSRLRWLFWNPITTEYAFYIPEGSLIY